jgi:putative ATPase
MTPKPPTPDHRPLADRIRPLRLDAVIGQAHLIGEGKPIRRAIERRALHAMILWGPPGSGKTTLARIIAAEIGAVFHELSAVSAGKADVRKVVESARKTRPQSGTILFLDEIHRFNKAQQDFLLPSVEDGSIILIGATTENPSFEVIPALLSRCRVYVLNELSETELAAIIVAGNRELGVELTDEAARFLARFANGDARTALNVLETAARLYCFPEKEQAKVPAATAPITLDDLKNALQSKHLRYDTGGEEHYNTISAFIKSMRASNPDAALYYLARMVEAGEDPKFIARRMVIFASEDIGMAQPTALVVANDVFRAVETIGYPECAINLAHGTVYLATARKDRAAYNGLRAAQADVRRYGNLPIPLNLRNAPTRLMKDLGYGKDYQKYSKEDLLPERLRGRRYYKPK